MEIGTLASEIVKAWETGERIELPSSRDGFYIRTAYAVEAELQRRRVEAGRRVTGRKVGYANKAAWRVLKLETLVWASMYDDTVQSAKELPIGGFVSPKIEPEIVFRLSRPVPAGDLDAQLSAAREALACVEWMALGFEIIDSPFVTGWQFKPADFVAAFGLHRALVVGEPRAVDPAAIEAIAGQLAAFKLKLFRNGELAQEGSGRNSLRSPALCLAELAKIAPLRAGELISTGTLTDGQPIAPGEVWHVEVEGLDVPGIRLALEC